MAKVPMICPFSKKLCRECSYYVGRHYYLCFFEGYRGHLTNPLEQESKKFPSSSGKTSNKA